MQHRTAVERVKQRRPFCADLSRASEEPLGATASRIDHWLLVEYRGAWRRDLLEGSLLSPRLKGHLREHLELLRPARLLFVKQPERRAESGRRVFLASTTPGADRLLGLEVEHQDDLRDVDLAGALSGRDEPFHPVAGPVLVVCTHGKRDRCCARYGRPLYDALRATAPGGAVWQSTHVGGDRFAGNVVALPQGTFHGRVEPDDVPGLLKAMARGHVDLDRYRGRSAYSFAAQAAERALRESEGLLGLDDLVLLGSEHREGETWRVRFRTPDGATHRLDVVAELGDPELLTCEAAEPRPPRRFRVTAHRTGR
ncbi:MAG TPA: sucrase ferredoxin [Gaiella sp.]